MRRPLVAVPAVAGLVAVVLATGKGLYVSPDAVFYVGTARNWLAGRGFSPPPGLPPVGHFPPLFTALLAAVGQLGLGPLTAARAVNALSYAGVVLLVGLVVRARTSSVPAALVASVLTAAAVDLLTYSASALSEPLFILLAVAGLVLLATYLDRPSPARLAAAVLVVAAAFLTRYVGVALVVAGVGVLAWRRRWAAAGVFGALTVAPVGVWLAWAGRQGPNDRSVAWHLFGAEYLGQAARPVSRWLVPWPVPPVGLVLAVVLAAGLVVLVRRRPAARSELSVLLWVFTGAYLAVLLANRALTDATGRLDARFLAPLHVVAVLLAVPALHRRRLPTPALVLAGVLVMGQLADAVAWTAGGLTDAGIGRRGYSAAALRRSAAVAEVQSDVLRPLYTNAVDGLFFLTGRAVTAIPAKKDYLTGKPNPHYDEELAAMRLALAGATQARLLYVAVPFRRSFQPTQAELEAALPLEVVARDAVATVYRLR